MARSEQESGVREIRTHRSMWRELETESRTGLRHRQLAKAVGNSYFPGLKITAPVPDPTEDDEPLVRQESVDGVGEVSPDLDHPAFVRTRGDPRDPRASGFFDARPFVSRAYYPHKGPRNQYYAPGTRTENRLRRQGAGVWCTGYANGCSLLYLSCAKWWTAGRKS